MMSGLVIAAQSPLPCPLRVSDCGSGVAGVAENKVVGTVFRLEPLMDVFVS